MGLKKLLNGKTRIMPVGCVNLQNMLNVILKIYISSTNVIVCNTNSMRETLYMENDDNNKNSSGAKTDLRTPPHGDCLPTQADCE